MAKLKIVQSNANANAYYQAKEAFTDLSVKIDHILAKCDIFYLATSESAAAIKDSTLENFADDLLNSAKELRQLHYHVSEKIYGVVLLTGRWREKK